MIELLKKEDAAVLRIDLKLHPAYSEVRDYRVYREDDLPAGLKPAFSKENTHEEACGLISSWLMCRAIPNWRINFLDSTASLYHWKKKKLSGSKISGYQHTASVLSYYASWFDRYTVTPVKTEYICYIFQDPSFYNLYHLKPADQTSLANLRMRPVTELDQCLKRQMNGILRYTGSFHSLSMTIRSELPSWWDMDEDGIYLAQDVTDREQKMDAFFLVCEKMGCRELRECSGKIFRTFYPYIDDVTWLSEYVPYLEQEGDIWRQIAERFLQEEKEKETLRWLKAFSEEMSATSYWMDACELGIGRCGEKRIPVMIL